MTMMFTLTEAGVLIIPLLCAIVGAFHGNTWRTPKDGDGPCGSIDENSNPGIIPTIIVNSSSGFIPLYTLTDIRDKNPAVFSVDRYRVVTLISGNFDFERERSLIFNVTVEDVWQYTTPFVKYTATCTIEVNDINEFAPVITHFTGPLILPNGTGSDVLVATVRGTDADGSPPNNLLQYYIMAGNINYDFYLDSGTGEIKVRDERELDKARTQVYNLTIFAQDGGIPVLHGATSIVICVDTCDVPTSAGISSTFGIICISVSLILAIYAPHLFFVLIYTM